MICPAGQSIFLPTAPPLILLDYLRPPMTTGRGQLHYSLMDSFWNFYRVENLIEYRPEQVCKDIAQESGLLTWLVKKLKVKVPFDNNKLYASGVTSISFSLTFVLTISKKAFPHGDTGKLKTIYLTLRTVNEKREVMRRSSKCCFS